MKKDYKEMTEKWLQKADDDLKFAIASFKEFDEFYSQMCVLCHDAAEKYLKTFLVSEGKEVEKIHNLTKLLNDCLKISKDKNFENFKEECKILNLYYVPLKYPADYPEANKEQAEEAMDIAEEIGNFIKQKLYN